MGEPGRVARWPLALAVGMPMVWTAIRATSFGSNLLYVVIGIPALLFL